MVTAIGSGLSALGSIAAGITGSDAASSAARQEADAYHQAQQFEQNVYNQTSQNLSPYVGTGTNALYSMADLLGLGSGSNGQGSGALDAYQQYTRTPYYTFPLQQGEQGLDQSAAARGLTLSGGQMNALQQYAQNYAGQQFGNYMSTLSSLAGMGSSAASTLGNQGNAAANTLLSALGGAGNALGQGTTASNAALMSGLGGSLNALTTNQNGSASTGTSTLGSLLSYIGGGGGSSYGNGAANGSALSAAIAAGLS
jgi:hypothetical protein